MSSLESQEIKNDAERSRRVGNIRVFVYTVYDYYPNSNLPEHATRRLVCPGPQKHATTPRALAIYFARRRISRGCFTISRDPGVGLFRRDILQLFFNATGIKFHAARLVIFWLLFGYLLVIFWLYFGYFLLLMLRYGQSCFGDMLPFMCLLVVTVWLRGRDALRFSRTAFAPTFARRCTTHLLRW